MVRRRRGFVVFATLPLLVASGCGDAPAPTLDVGRTGFSADGPAPTREAAVTGTSIRMSLASAPEAGRKWADREDPVSIGTPVLGPPIGPTVASAGAGDVGGGATVAPRTVITSPAVTASSGARREAGTADGDMGRLAAQALEAPALGIGEGNAPQVTVDATASLPSQTRPAPSTAPVPSTAPAPSTVPPSVGKTPPAGAATTSTSTTATPAASGPVAPLSKVGPDVPFPLTNAIGDEALQAPPNSRSGQLVARGAPRYEDPPPPPPPVIVLLPSDADLARLRACESGGDYGAVSSGGLYRGAYQFDRSTWNSVATRHYPGLVGGDPAGSSVADQDAMARALWSERGWAPWPTCGRSL